MENGHLQWIFPLKMVIFHSYVSLPEGKEHAPQTWFKVIKSVLKCWWSKPWDPSRAGVATNRTARVSRECNGFSGAFLKWRYPQSSSISTWDFSWTQPSSDKGYPHDYGNPVLGPWDIKTTQKDCLAKTTWTVLCCAGCIFCATTR